MAKESDAKFWDMPAHTKAKHEILHRYLGAWFPKMASHKGRIIFLDGFAGRGKYNDGSEGSPIIALRRLMEHRARVNLDSCEFVFVFNERDPDNANSLRAVIDTYKATHAPFPANVKTIIAEGSFEETVSEILDDLESQGKQIAPTLAFVDPFGYTGLSIDVIARLCASSGSEVLVNFMVGHVMRFVERDGQEAAIESLFGLTPDELMRGYGTDQKRVEFIRDRYTAQLKSVANFPYVINFEMKLHNGNTTYFLVFGTRHPSGVKSMKEAMWKADPEKGSTFSDRLDGTDVLFVPQPDLLPLRAAMLEKYKNQDRVRVEDIEWFAILETPYRETHIRGVLTALENDGQIRVSRPGKRGFPKSATYIDFT